MELEEFKQKFSLPRITAYIETLSEEQINWFWELLWSVKQVFPKLDIYHAGSSKYGYLGFGKKTAHATRVEEFLFVLHLEKNAEFTLFITAQTYRLISSDEDILPQSYDQEIQKKGHLSPWLQEAKKHIAELGTDLAGEDLFPVDYEIENYFTTFEAFNFLNKKYKKIRELTKKIVGFRNNLNREMALILDNSKPTLFIGIDPEYNNLFRFNFIDNNSKINGRYDENQGRHDGLKSHAPSLYKGNKAFYIEINSLEDLEGFCEWYELETNTMLAQSKSVSAVKKDNEMINQPLNRILFGAAGTGKTFHTINHALSIIENKSLELLENEDRTELKKRFDAYQARNQIKFVTFHQSFSYEDFVEGIRAESDDLNNLKYKVESGVFKKLCEQATGITQQDYSIDEVIEKFLEEITESSLELSTQQNKKFKVSYLGGGLTIQCQPLSSENNATYYANISKIKSALVGEDLGKVYNRSYIKAVAEYLKPQINLSSSLIHPQDYVLIIDEINRGNISRIFGELITLIEDSKRAGAEEELSVTLPYSEKEFSVPSNVYIIGTMNSSDRSLTGLDIALRRRFTFVEMPPKPELLNDILVEGLNIGELLRVINQRIEVLLDRDHCIGHANFMSLKKQQTREHLATIFKQKIIPQLQEYFFDDWAKINMVFFNNKMLIEDVELNISNLFLSNFEQELGFSNEKKVWKINTEAFETIDAFIQILGLKD